MKPIGVYLHLPFCVRKCAYCDFVSYAGQEQCLPQYFQAIQRELAWYQKQEVFSEYQPRTLYIGGGTPSLATEYITSLLRQQSTICAKSVQEATIEVNPGTIRSPLFEQLLQAGLNRVSIGVQSFHDTELRTLGRIHTAEEAVVCAHAARQAGFQNISLDLMFGIPGSKLDDWRVTLDQAIRLNPEHVSIYNLTIEEGTPFWMQQQQGMLALPEEDEQLAMYEIGISTLIQAGYEHYEISNFALPGYRSQHNQIYWRNEEYVGLGAGAHSYVNGHRYWNTSDLEIYITSFHATKPHPQVEKDVPPFYPLTTEGKECLNQQQTIGETIMMNLRLLEGIDLTAFRERYGQSIELLFPDRIQTLCALGLLEIRADHLRLTHKGLLLANEVFREFVNLS